MSSCIASAAHDILRTQNIIFSGFALLYHMHVNHFWPLGGTLAASSYRVILSDQQKTCDKTFLSLSEVVYPV